MDQITKEVTAQVHKMRELHERMAKGEFEELNTYYSKNFIGYLYMPKNDIVEQMNYEAITTGNCNAANFYKGKDIQFKYSGLTIIPQASEQVAVSYEILFKEQDIQVKALSLEVWKKEYDGIWRMIRWYEEKGSATLREGGMDAD
ncbi:hypothetical protein DH09_20360 [Bacillaceae bacterium JMAK1]|nr:hypothetical protein DH09_20360 [Bacillaceae bacterium JMAK1]